MLKIELIRFEADDVITSSPPTAAAPSQNPTENTPEDVPDVIDKPGMPKPK